MVKTYSQFLEKIRKLLDTLKKNIVVSHLFLKVFYLLVLFIVKFFFVCVALPYYLFAEIEQPIKNLKKNSLEKFTVSHLRLQKIVTVSSLVIVVLGFGFHFFFSSFRFEGNTLHGAANGPLQFSGYRSYEDNTHFAIRSVDVSPVDFIAKVISSFRKLIFICFNNLYYRYSHPYLSFDNVGSFLCFF